MNLIVLLLLLFCLGPVLGAIWTRLKIGLGQYESEEKLNYTLRRPLYEAIHNLETMILVNDAVKEHVLDRQSIAECSSRSERLKSVEWLFTNDIVKTFTPTSEDMSLQDQKFNFLLLALTGGEECERLQNVLARAYVCYFSNQKKPILGRMQVCWKNAAWMSFESAYDLFRHEILHALGYGLLVPSPPIYQEETRMWRDGRGQSQSFTVYGMDFSRRALSYVRRHFRCSILMIVEAENEDRKHLNEYIFGNELMTPVLNNGKNYFTKISALILEDTFVGKHQWYKTVETKVQRETEGYWYGRQWGCTFATKSCSDYVEEQATRRKPSFPFCTFHDYGRSTPRKICAKTLYNTTTISLQCPILLSDYLPQLRDQSSYGSAGHHRFCPFSQNVLNGQIEIVSSDSVLVEC
ncbi:hypothetical protein QR680_001643 [Steinernema hermaphroditum]|uniref:Leishmanolysin-like peptidase n=1 Tax=Steinernema hermaphroditum TaxID=289476 RepID=A0AA39LGD3_9BILA|nr:hypothetical protein QR680_001643 [Steinernema hermaphroditum]